MKIRRISVERFRSLRQVVMEDVGNLTLLIGANSSGKTNLLEALTVLIDELDPALERKIGAVDDYIWFNRDDRQPIVFGIDLELGRDDVTGLGLDEQAFKLGDSNKLSIVRKIGGPRSSAAWKTQDVALNNVPMVENGAPAPPANVTGNAMKILFERLKGKLVYIGASRDMPMERPRLGPRTSLIDRPTLNELVSLGQRTEAEQMGKWDELESRVTQCSPSIEDIRILGTEMMLKERDRKLRVPVSLVGGGHQAVMALLCRMQQKGGDFYVLEEPETHLNPLLIRELLAELKKVAQEKQVFITTHSTVFVDQTDLDNVWVVKVGRHGTEITRVHEPLRLTSILQELGSRPSDIFFADAIIFVEGPTEQKVIPIWGEKIGMDLLKCGVKVRPIYGKDSGKYHLTVLTDATENFQVPSFMILDQDAEAAAKKLVKSKSLVLNKNLFLLTKGSIEEYYPIDKFIEALTTVLKSEYDLELTDEETKAIRKGPRSESVGDLLVKKLKLKKATGAWKPIVGEIVAESMTLEEIDDEIKRILERIRTELKLP